MLGAVRYLQCASCSALVTGSITNVSAGVWCKLGTKRGTVVAVVIIHGSTGVTLKGSQGSLMLINVLYYALLCALPCLSLSVCVSSKMYSYTMVGV